MAKSRPVKRILTVLILAGAAAGAWFYYKNGKVSAPIFTTVSSSKGEISQVITATGTLEPVTSVEVGSQVSGLITKVLVDFNTPVTAGQVLATIDPATYEQRLRQAEADHASSDANHTLVRLNTERTRALRAKNLVTQQELDQAEANLAQAAANLLTRQASVENAKVDLARCTIYAPVDGMVLDRKVEVGKTVAASLNAPVLFVIADDLAKMQINGAIAEADIGSVEVGQTVNFTVDAFPDRQFRGRVVQIRNSPTTQSNVVTYQTIIEVRNSDLKLKPGMTANISVVIANRRDVVRVANAALRVRMPKSLLPEAAPAAAPADANADRSRGPGNADPERRQKMQQLMQDAGYDRSSGPPTPEVRARMAALAKERGIELPSSGGGGRERARDEPGTARTVYRLGGTALTPSVESITVKLGITDGINTEVLSGLDEGVTLITSALIPDENGQASGPTTNPFSGSRRRF